MPDHATADESKWASYVRAHRLSQNLNQSQFAKMIGVSQQTVSSWESGGQIPEPAIQEKLRGHLRVTALNSLAYWRHRVTHAAGFDVLVAGDLTVLAASRRALRVFGVDEAPAGVRLPHIVPQHEIGSSVTANMTSLESFIEIGFFDGLIRSIRLDMDWHVPSGSCACKTDVWPVMTSEQSIVGHLSGAPSPIPPDAGGFRGIRVKHVTVRLNKDVPDE
jgi:transcriptional regulator with XRE-family HTH domain